MLMCDTCYSLFKENNSNNNNNCYNYGCTGNLVRVDNEIGYHISELNKRFRSRGDGVRTKFCGSARVPSTFRSYIVFTGNPNFIKKNEFSMNIEEFHDFVNDHINNVNDKYYQYVLTEFQRYDLDTSELSKKPFTVYDVFNSHESSDKEFKIEFNIFEHKFIKANIKTLIRASNISMYLFSNELIDLHSELSK